jgi:hypothetical protein
MGNIDAPNTHKRTTPWIWKVSVWLNFDNEMIKTCKKYNWYLHYIICEFQRINTIQSQICNYNLLHKQYSRLKTYMVINDIFVSFRVDVWNHKTSLTPKWNQIITETDMIDIPNIHIRVWSLSWEGTCISIKVARLNLRYPLSETRIACGGHVW